MSIPQKTILTSLQEEEGLLTPDNILHVYQDGAEREEEKDPNNKDSQSRLVAGAEVMRPAVLK